MVGAGGAKPTDSSLPSIGGGAGGGELPSIGGAGRPGFAGLGGVYGRQGGFDVDREALARANAELAKLNKIADYSHLANQEEEKKEDGRSMLEVMQEKRRAAEADIAAKQANMPAQPTGETMEERAARLKAQRDLLRRMKEEKRQKELAEFNTAMDQGASNSANTNLAEEFKQLDANKKLPVSSNPEMDRRRMIYKNVRKEIAETDQAEKERNIANKMQNMEAKV